LIGQGRHRKDWIQETSIQPLTSAIVTIIVMVMRLKGMLINDFRRKRPKAPEIPEYRNALLILMFSALAEAYLPLENQ
jgi:hypothetical protein